MISTIISGGQTGVDQAALFVAKSLGFNTGGWAPINWKTSIGPEPRLGTVYNLKEYSGGYHDRTIQNIKDSDATLILATNFNSAGTKLTINAASSRGKPTTKYHLIEDNNINSICDWILSSNISILNVAGNRQPQTNSPDIYSMAGYVLWEVFSRIKLKS